MEENTTGKETIEQSKENIKKDARGLYVNIKNYLKELLDFRDDTDYEATMQAIKADISFKGATAWILIFAIFVASIGLNVSSPAVVIGAMLISPLMGPILGIGAAFAINDIDVFKKSIVSLLTMIALSLLASFIYFYLFPGGEEDTSELLGRVKPDIRDVLIAFFGGLALMIARTKKGTIASVIFGVAIATALMPPLCTAGFGLAKGISGDPIGYTYLMGAMFLFFINTIFIALATFIVLKLLRFPMHTYASVKKRNQYTVYATVLGVSVTALAIWTFIGTLNENRIHIQINKFVNTEIKSNGKLQLMDTETLLEDKKLKLNFFNEIAESTINALNNQLKNNQEYSYLKDFDLIIKGSDTSSYELITTAYNEKRAELKEHKLIIKELNEKVSELEETIKTLTKQKEEGTIQHKTRLNDLLGLFKDAKIKYTEIEEIGFANVLKSKNFIRIDTVPQLFIKWKPFLQDSIANSKENEVKAWFQTEMKLDTVYLHKD